MGKRKRQVMPDTPRQIPSLSNVHKVEIPRQFQRSPRKKGTTTTNLKYNNEIFSFKVVLHAMNPRLMLRSYSKFRIKQTRYLRCLQLDYVGTDLN